MFRLDNILEHWASIYKPISHNAEKKHVAFYRIDTITAESTFVRNVNTAASPAMAYSTVVDAEFNYPSIKYGHTIYFLVKQKGNGAMRNSTQDDMEAAECKYMLDQFATDLVMYLKKIKTEVASHSEKYDKETVNGLFGLDFDSVTWGTAPTKYNGWWVLIMGIDQITQIKQCVVTERYTQGSLNEKGFPLSLEE